MIYLIILCVALAAVNVCLLIHQRKLDRLVRKLRGELDEIEPPDLIWHQFDQQWPEYNEWGEPICRVPGMEDNP